MTRRGRRFGLTVCLMGLVMTLPLMRAGVNAQGADEGANAPSPAGTHAEVIAQGVGDMPAAQVAWRLVQDTAEAYGEAGYQQRALGFAVATDDALLLTDESDGAMTRLARGEAAFVGDGVNQRRESLGNGSTPYWRIALVPADQAEDAGGDTLVYGGEGFAVQAEARDMDLVAAKLDGKKSTTVESEFPVLVVVANGTASVAPASGGDAVTLDRGEATTIDGSVELTAEKSGTRVLVAVIGPQVIVSDDISPVADDDDSGDTDTDNTDTDEASSQILVTSERCPVGVTGDQALDNTSGDPCFGGDPVGSMTVTLVNQDTGETTTDTIHANGMAAFPGLAAGNYSVLFDAGDLFGETIGFCGGQDRSADLPVVEFTASSVELELPAEREYDCVTRTITLPDEEPTFGSIGATFYACPSGMTFATFDASQCELITDGFDFGFQSSVDFHLSDAGVSGGGYVWHNFPLDDGDSWSPVVYSYPDGYNWYAISTDGGEELEPHAGGYQLTSDQPMHVIEVYFFESRD